MKAIKWVGDKLTLIIKILKMLLHTALRLKEFKEDNDSRGKKDGRSS